MLKSFLGPSVDHLTSLILELQALFVSERRPWTHEASFRVSAVALSLSTVKHGSFHFAYFLKQMKKQKKNLKNCACLGLYTIYPTGVDQ